MNDGSGARFRCATCDMELERPGFFYLGLAFCCAGCAADGPCTCSYDENADPSLRGDVPAVAWTSRRSRPRLRTTEPPQVTASFEDAVDGLGLPFVPVAVPEAERFVAAVPLRHPDGIRRLPVASRDQPSMARPELARTAAD